MLWNRLFGVASTVGLIRRCAAGQPRLSGVPLEEISLKIDLWCGRYPYLFVGRSQKCLIRGYLLYFYGKRSGRPVQLIFGASESAARQTVKWHCWIMEEGRIKFEVPEVIGDYTPFLEYS